MRSHRQWLPLHLGTYNEKTWGSQQSPTETGRTAANLETCKQEVHICCKPLRFWVVCYCVFIPFSHSFFKTIFFLSFHLLIIKKLLASQKRSRQLNQASWPMCKVRGQGLPSTKRLAIYWEIEKYVEDNGSQVSYCWEKREYIWEWRQVELGVPDLANENIGYHLGLMLISFCF